MSDRIILKKEPGYDMSEQYLGYECLHLLNTCYPGWTWNIKINSMPTGGVMTIWCMELACAAKDAGITGGFFGAELHLSEIYADPDRRAVISRAGYILEFGCLPESMPDDEMYVMNLQPFARNYINYQDSLVDGLN